MSERTVFDALYISEGEWFVGSIDDGGTVYICSRDRPAIGGIRPEFIDRKGKKREYADILVRDEDIENVTSALEANDLRLPVRKEKVTEDTEGKPPVRDFIYFDLRFNVDGQIEVETLVVYDARHPEEYENPEEPDLYSDQ